MTDERFEARFESELRSMLRRKGLGEPPTWLRMAVAAIPERGLTPDRARTRRLWFGAMAGAAALVLLAGGALFVLSSLHQPVPVGVPPGVPATLGPTPLQPTTTPAILHRALDFRVLPDLSGHTVTTDDLEADQVVMLDRLGVYWPSNNGSSYTNELPLKVTLLVDVTTDDMAALDRIADVVGAHGEVRAVAVDRPAAPPLFTQADVESAELGTSETGQATLDITLSPAAAATFATWSSANIASTFDITLDGNLELTPVIRGPITDGKLTLTGPDPDTLKRLAAILKSGPLPFPVERVDDATPSPH